MRCLCILILVAAAAVAQSPSNAPASSQNGSPTADEILAFMAALSNSTPSEQAAPDQLAPTFRFFELYDSNPLGAVKRPNPDYISSFGGSLALAKHWQHTAITANYAGGADYYANFDGQNQAYHEFNGAESFTLGRAKFLVGGNYEFLPASSFGFDATHQISQDSYTLINPELVPDQGIQTQPLARQSYTGLGQLELKLTDRAAIDFSGSYGRLRYEKSAIPGTNQASAGAGYSYALSSRDSIGVTYQYGLYETSHEPLQVVDSVISGSYAHRFGENLVLKLGAGPDLRSYNGVRAASLQGIDPSLSANSQLDYSRGSSHLNLSYFRATVSGQGILLGSQSDEIQFAMAQNIGHGFAVNGSFGYDRSTSLAKVVQTRNLVDQVVNSDFFSTGLSKRIGPVATLVFAYSLQNQDSSAPICTAGLCQTYPLHHVITFGFTISPKPLSLGR
jgi:hypothetical protein